MQYSSVVLEPDSLVTNGSRIPSNSEEESGQDPVFQINSEAMTASEADCCSLTDSFASLQYKDATDLLNRVAVEDVYEAV
ncbi:UNVERIFIED_CONTAM: hypothetical protein K2H54_022397 [Gekko kuhli]